MVENYIKAMASRWSTSTLASENSRLRALSNAIDGDPDRLVIALSGKQPYTVYTSFIRVAALWGWAYSEEPNPYKTWLAAHKKRHAYKPKKVPLSFEEAEARIETITDPGTRRRALEILFSAQRWSESEQTPLSGEIRGKGGKPRPSFRPQIEGPALSCSYDTFLRRLKAATGLTPHALRKLALTRLARKGATAPDLMRVAGWSDLSTALVYIQERRDEELKEMMK